MIECRIMNISDLEMAQLRYRVFHKLGFLPESEEKIDQDAEDERSVHFGAYLDGVLCGTLRLICGELSTLPVSRHFQLLDPKWDAEAVEVSRLAIEGPERQAILLSILKVAMDWSFSEGRVHWFFALDEQMHSILIKKYKFRLIDLGTEKFYMGSMTIPSYADIRETLKQLAIDNPTLKAFWSYRGPAFPGK